MIKSFSQTYLFRENALEQELIGNLGRKTRLISFCSLFSLQDDACKAGSVRAVLYLNKYDYNVIPMLHRKC